MIMTNKQVTSRRPLVRQFLLLLLGALLFAAGCSSPLPVKSSKNTDWMNHQVAAKSTPYLLGPGDKLAITSTKWQDLNVEVEIDSQGDIQYPYLGRVHSKDLTIDELRGNLTKGLQDYYRTPRLTINLLEQRQRFAYIMGEVLRPGPIPLSGETTLIDALGLAGGSTPDAAMQNVAFLRPSEGVTYATIMDLTSFQPEGDRQFINTRLQEKDVIYVPASAIANVERFFIRLGHMTEPLLDIERGIILVPDLEDAVNNRDNNNNRTIVISR